jgi:hypothetical protein
MPWHRHPRFSSTLVALAFAGLALWHLRQGPESTPAAAREVLRWVFGYDLAVAARLLVAAEFAVAAAVLLVGNRFISFLACGTGAFVALAGLSRAVREGGLLPAAGALVLFGTLLWLTWRAQVNPAGTVSRRGLSPAWSLLGAIAAATTAAHLSANLTFTGTRPVQTGVPSASSGSASAPSVVTINLEMRPYGNKPIAESVLGRHMPELADLCSIENAPAGAYIVVYNPSCESCYGLFLDNFAIPRPEVVIAISIPLADGAVSAAQEAPRPIECLDCTELSLPQGPNWLVASPMVLKIDAGIVTCVADRFGGDCLPK